MMPMTNRRPTGAGSRGGHWHEPGFPAMYQRAWRAAHPEYREREALRLARRNAPHDKGRAGRNGDPADIVVAATYPRPLPEPAVTCVCACGCREAVVVCCGFCRDGIHGEAEALS
jgi:hypothetical protein